MQIRVCSLLLLITVSNAFALDICGDLSRTSSERSGREILCQCGPELEKLKVKPPAGMGLYAVCDLHTAGQPYPNLVPQRPLDLKKVKTLRREEIGNGVYYYKGSAIVAGIIKKGDEPNQGSLYFYPDTWSTEHHGKLQKARIEIAQFGIGGEAFEKKIGTTKLEAEWNQPYWCAHLTIRLKEYLNTEWDNDDAGRSVLQAEILKIGKFKRCKREP